MEGEGLGTMEGYKSLGGGGGGGAGGGGGGSKMGKESCYKLS